MNLEECTLVELRQLAKERGIKSVSKLKKDELITMLSSNENNDISNDTNVKTRESILSKEDNKIYNSEQDYDISEESTEQDVGVQETEVRYVDGYKWTSPDDRISEGILEILPDGYGF